MKSTIDDSDIGTYSTPQEWLELYKGTAPECAQMATWLAIEMAGRHIQLKMDHGLDSSEWSLYCQVLPSIPGLKTDPNRKEIPRLVKRYLSEY